MRTIGLLGGTAWSSTMTYYRILNQMVQERLRGDHSARILLYSIDYHNLHESYTTGDEANTCLLLRTELEKLLSMNPDSFMICCNSLHKYYDRIQTSLNPQIPLFHGPELVASYCLKQGYKKVLLLATKFTLHDGFFARKLEEHKLNVIIPSQVDIEVLHGHHHDLMNNLVTRDAQAFFQDLVAKHQCEAVVLGCTEFPLVVNQENTAIPIVDPIILQTQAAVDFALS